MSKNIWDDEPFRDGQQEFSNGQWKPAETYAPVAENTIKAARALQQQQAVAEEELDIDELTDQVANEDDDDDFSEVLSDARLRLEQGKLYEMIMNHNLFEGFDADPRAVKSVQKQIVRFAKEKMECMLGMRQDPLASTNLTVSSPFNDLEVQILKKLASAASKGATETEEANQVEPAQPFTQPVKKKTLNTIGSKPQPKPQPKPIAAKKPEPIKRQARPKNDLPPEMEPDYEPLSKPIHEMSPNELAERDRQALERQRGRKSAMPTDRAPMPDYATQEMLAMSQVQRAAGGVGGMSALNGKLSQLVMANTKKS